MTKTSICKIKGKKPNKKILIHITKTISLKHKEFISEFPGGLWLGLGAFTARSPGSIPGQGTKIPQAVRHSQK